MAKFQFLAAIISAAFTPLVDAVSSQTYTWKNVKIGGGGGFVPGIVFNPTQKGLAFARTDIGGAYKLNADDTWTPLLDFADDSRWNYWGVDALATDPVQPNRLYLATGMYTNSWDPSNGQILVSTDTGATFTPSKLPFKVGGNMPGRGMGERLAIDPNSNGILYFGARSGNGLWKSTDFGVTWAKVSSFTSPGTYRPDPTDTSGYNNDIIGISWVTFDKTSGSSGSPTPRIFVGVASNGTNNVFVSNNAGNTWSAVPGQNTQFFPHKGVLSPAEKVLYVSYSDGAGPYDGTAGAVYKYNITSGVWTNVTPVSGSDLYFGFGGVAVDLQKPGTVMVAALNSWWPDGQIFRSTDSGTTWSPLWSWQSYPTMNKFYTYSDSLAPWLGPNYVDTTPGDKQIGWMMEALVIDPFDSNHWLYGTGATLYGGHDLLKWDTTHNVTISSLADGIEETSIQGLISPPTGPPLISAVGDIGGFSHTSLTVAPKTGFINPTWATTADVDFAGNKPTNIVRIGTGDSSTGKQVALSTDSGATWNQDYGAADNVQGGKVAFSADGDTVLWRTNGNGVQVSQYTNAFVTVPSLPSTAAIASDKRNNSIFYGAAGSSFYLSTDGGKTFVVKGSLGASTAPVKIVVNPGVTGDVWVSTDVGLFHSTNSGTSFTAISGITQAWAIALGAPATSTGYPAVFAVANIGGIGYFRSDDGGVNWVKINDAAHGFGSASASVLTADPRIYGRVYIGTNGRGIFYGDAVGSAPPSTTMTTATPTTTTTTTSNSPTTTTTKTTTTTTKTTTTTSGAPTSTGAQVPAYGQCGGTGWTGGTHCVSGYTCTYSNPYYSQCVPS
ncbi:Oligoxyloglucan reducing end-specific cellobiohydrolase [Pholiota conissans]|uniref:Oligoxyloglucan reducing end-specific cellobiohydrolase n=1 Tax=Pholiota conissans TaxID=109636 RepID=A0A9P6CUX7_9AGAR|nr:Oligoxyloglucan reducing end-specific cellobiohydrolase [Pholiota conissans]